MSSAAFSALHSPGIVLQTRMGSTRLPGKALKPLCGTNLLALIASGVRAAHPTLPFIVATTDLERDDDIAAFCAQQSIACYRGSEEDVLQRFVGCAAAHGLDSLVRMTGDNPFPVCAEIPRLLAALDQADYVHCLSAYPYGVGLEAARVAALQAAQRSTSPRDHEHVTIHLREHPQSFVCCELSALHHLTDADKALRLTVDTPEDFARAEAIIASLGQSPYVLEDVLRAARLAASQAPFP